MRQFQACQRAMTVRIEFIQEAISSNDDDMAHQQRVSEISEKTF